MNCCPLSGNDDGAPGASATVTARKPHECCECRESIPAGAKYERYVVFDEGSAEAYKTCLSCVEIRNHFACNGWLFGCVWGDIEQNFFPDMVAGGPCLKGLSPAAMARMFERRLAWLERQSARRTRRGMLP